ncbi:electron transport complex subunit RsxC [Halioglobus sp. HI00S01]|uniref:electron transport complex subunit RsxC n=1 Tax=Halioglobus sp. HI00S01 TaxID=1822214 RepID=UPI0007C30DC7|nr:electron transport complex subunit RsxC [Halioglobus sp. HI00S01]KZX59610.1 electron transport complex subunit RsxC [Halioglobus sp. HI00S01]
MRKIFDFHGGIHPAENKYQSVRTPIAQAGIPAQLILPLAQHIGAPAMPVVEVGEKVLKGQVIAEPVGFVSVPLHAPSSGLITAIEDRQIAHPSGRTARCIVIDTDGQDEWIAHSGTDNYRELDKSELINRIRNAGIAGMGGAGFPSAVKLSVRPDTRIDTLIINGTECEPYITADDILMRERADKIIAGAQILSHLISPGEILIGVEDNKPEGIAALTEAAADTDIQIVIFPTKYPSGGEKQLIEILTGKQVPSGGLPSDVGIVCQNIGTTVAIRDAVIDGRPLVSRVTTVTGDSVAEPQNFETLLGTPMGYLLEQAGYAPEKNNRLIMGGPMMGFTVPRADVPIVKTTNCVLAPTEAELPTPPPAQACIRCGTCSEACPASLLPQQMFWFAQGQEYEKLEQHNLFDCIECGACSYVCPSHIPLVQYYRASKAEILQQRKDAEKSEYSLKRFEARQERLAREEAEKEAKRAARKKAAEAKAKQAAEQGAIEEDPIQAAIERAKAKKAAQAEGASGENELEKLEKAVVNTRKRLDTATAKLETAKSENPDLVDALQTGVDKTRAKLAAAEKALQDYQQANAPESASAAAEPADAAQLAIQKAMAAREADASKSPEEKARDNLTKLESRLAKSQAKLAQSRDAGDEEKIIDALVSTVERLTGKVEEARAELAKLAPAAEPAAAAAEPPSAADAAIARAKAAREATAAMSPAEKARDNLQKLEARLQKSTEKLAAAREAGDDTVVEALEASLEKMNAKIDDARAKVAEMGDA